MKRAALSAAICRWTSKLQEDPHSSDVTMSRSIRGALNTDLVGCWDANCQEISLRSRLEILGIALPAAFLRWSIPPSESAIATHLLALLVGVLALVDHKLRVEGHLQYFELSLSLAQPSFFCSFCRWGFVFSYVLSQRSVLDALSAATICAASVSQAVRFNVQLHLGSGKAISLKRLNS